MASIDYDPFFVRLQELGCELGSEEYVQALIWRLNMELKPDGKKIETEDYSAFSEAISLVIDALETKGQNIREEYDAGLFLPYKDPMEEAAKHWGLADTLYQLAIETGFLEQDGWLHHLMGYMVYNPLLMEKEWMSPNGGEVV